MTIPNPILNFVTSNPHKAAEVEALLGTRVQRVDRPVDEIQASSLEEIVKAKLERARRGLEPFVAVEDVSLGLTELGGFPGPYVKWLLEATGGAGLARIAGALSDRSALARCLVALWDGNEIHLFEGRVRGVVLTEPRGETAFGWDAWFLPEGSEATYGEMSLEEKSRLSHRSLAWIAVRDGLFNRR